MKNKFTFNLIAGLSLVFGSTIMNVAQAAKMNSQEMGTYHAVNRIVSPFYDEYKKAKQAWGVTQGHRRQNAGHDHWHDTKRRFCYLTIQMLNEARKYEKSKNKVYLITPRAITPYMNDVMEYRALARKYSHITHCNQMSGSDLTKFYRAAEGIFNRFTNLYNAYDMGSKKKKMGWSTTFSVELTPIPLKLEVIEGSLKIKLSKKVGPFNFDLQTGPKFKGNTTKSGLQYLAIINPNRSIRYFYIDGLKLSLHVPESLITINGNTLIIECSAACLKSFEA